MKKAELDHVETDLSAFIPAGAAAPMAPLPVAELDDNQRLACLQLARSDNVGPVAFRQLINTYGSATDALDALPEHAARTGRSRYRVCRREKAEAELEACEKAGIKTLFTIEPGFPVRLALLDAPPPLLFVKGRTKLLNAPSLAIVGARRASAAGHKMARMFASELGVAGLVIASGLARGIDSAAHEAALDTGTIAVLAGGVDVVYPPENADLLARVADQGCIISEMPCGHQPRAKDFPRRNRVISGIALGVLVVEAAARSGSLITASVATEQGREVFAIPGHPLDPRAEGTNQLLKSGATLVTAANDILDMLRPLAGPELSTFNEPHRQVFRQQKPVSSGSGTTPPDTVGASSAGITAPVLDEKAVPTADIPADAIERILAALGPAPVDADEIVRATGLPAHAVRACLTELDLDGRIERHGINLISLKT